MWLNTAVRGGRTSILHLCYGTIHFRMWKEKKNSKRDWSSKPHTVNITQMMLWQGINLKSAPLTVIIIVQTKADPHLVLQGLKLLLSKKKNKPTQTGWHASSSPSLGCCV